jgi:quercetin dioxygenase-like cupin family protein
MRLVIVGVVALAVVGFVDALSAQQGRVPRSILQRADSSVPGYETIAAAAEFAPGAQTGWHSHPGDMVGYMVEGAVRLEQQGKASTIIAAGNTFIIAAGIAHNETNEGTSEARMLATYVVEKGRPLNSEIQ